MDETQQELGQQAEPVHPQGSGQQSIFYRSAPSMWSWLSATVFTLAGLMEMYVLSTTKVAMEADPVCLAKAAANTSNPFAATGALCPMHPIGGFGAFTGPIIAWILLIGGGLWLSMLLYRTVLRKRLS